MDQPYSCSQWGNYGTIGIPSIVDDGTANTVINWFENPSSSGLGSLIVFFDHTMTVANIMSSSPSFNVANAIIENLLEGLPPLSNENSPGVINQFNLTRLYPNPFNPVLNINFDIAWPGITKVNILDIYGSYIETLHSGFLQSGSHEMSWNAESMPSGVYFISLKLGDKNLTEKVVLLK